MQLLQRLVLVRQCFSILWLLFSFFTKLFGFAKTCVFFFSPSVNHFILEYSSSLSRFWALRCTELDESWTHASMASRSVNIQCSLSISLYKKKMHTKWQTSCCSQAYRQTSAESSGAQTAVATNNPRHCFYPLRDAAITCEESRNVKAELWPANHTHGARLSVSFS